MANNLEVVVGATAKDFVLQVVDENNLPRDITGGTFHLIGESDDLPSVDISEEGDLTNPSVGEVTFRGVGGYVTMVQLGLLERATFTFRVRWTSGVAPDEVFDYTPPFAWDYVPTPGA